MRTTRSIFSAMSPAILLSVLSLSSLSFAQQNLPEASAVLLGQSADRSVRAYYSPEIGLWLSGFQGRERCVIGHGSEPRFDEQGTLWFTRSYDDGRMETRRETLRWGVADFAPRVVDAKLAPAYRLAPERSSPNAATVKLCIDPGHGGRDPGALGNGLRESDVNLKVSQRLKYWLDLDTRDTRGGGTWNILMTRTGNQTLSLAARTNAANNFRAQSFVSIHMNAFSSTSANGSETFCYRGQGSRTGGRLRNRLHNELIAAWRLRNRGVKEAGFYVLRYTRMPAALVEGGFITNRTDSSRMKSDSYINNLARGLMWALQEHHGLRRYTPSNPVANGRLRGIVYNATRGTGSRIRGATIRISGGPSTRSSSTGYFQFSLAPRRYSYLTSAPGFRSRWQSRTIYSNRDTWGSVGLYPSSAPSIYGQREVSPGSMLTLEVRADAHTPVLLFVGGQMNVIDCGAFGLLVPDLASSAVIRAGMTSAQGKLDWNFVTTPAMAGMNALVQPFSQNGKAWRLGNVLDVSVR